MKRIIMKLTVCIAAVYFLSLNANAQTYSLSSPDGKTTVELQIDGQIKYAVLHNQHTLIASSVIGVATDFAASVGKVKKQVRSSEKQVLYPLVRQKNKQVNDIYNQLKLTFSNKYSLEWRAYNNGVAWRWIIDKKGDYKVANEQVNFQLATSDSVWYPLENSFYSHNERLYDHWPVDSTENKLASLPALVNINGTKLLITESDLFDYAGLWLRGAKNGLLQGVFPHYPKEKKISSDRDEEVVSREDFIARQSNAHTLPWRVLMIADRDEELLTNQLVYQLSRPANGDYTWVKPGKAQWDWWNDNNVYEVNFKAGVNTATYKYYIDFASQNGLEYVVLDEGWSNTENLLKVVDAIDMNELAAYAKEKNVGLILWTTWLALDRQMEAALDQFARWGIKGIKVDFMQRDDQEMVNYYERTAIEAAKRKLLVDFHGAYKPTGMERTYPNVITREGVFGLEQSKWDPQKRIDPEHNVTLPFIRMAAGPMDYTPGAMLNAQKKDWKPVWSNPGSLGTRCHQLAMYVIYESPLQMLADNPTHYLKEPECMQFLKQVPTVWDTTIALQAKLSDYVVMARRAANGDWYIGAMTDWNARDISIDLSFLNDGNYTIDTWQDGINADRNAMDFAHISKSLEKNKPLSIHLAPGGGFVAVIRK
ncbi:MAG: glycoside hydrolase family 97 protein [Flavisolibacter sp.]